MLLIVTHPETRIRYHKSCCRFKDLPRLTVVFRELQTVYQALGGDMRKVAEHPYTREAVSLVFALMPSQGISDAGISYSWVLQQPELLKRYFFTTSDERYDFGEIFTLHTQAATLPESRAKSTPCRSSGNDIADTITSLLPAGGIEFVDWCLSNLTFQDIQAVNWRLGEISRPAEQRSQEYYLQKIQDEGADIAATDIINEIIESTA